MFNPEGPGDSDEHLKVSRSSSFGNNSAGTGWSSPASSHAGSFGFGFGYFSAKNSENGPSAVRRRWFGSNKDVSVPASHR